MRVLFKTLATAGLLTLLLPVAALAQWRDGGREAGRDRGGGRSGYERSYGGAERGPRYDGYGRYGGGQAGYGAGGYGGSGYGQPRGGWGAPSYAPQAYRGGGGYGGGYRRGQVLPPEQRGAYVTDPGRYHLRAAPPGYGWVGDGRNAYLTQRSTGMVLDSVPGAYDPPPPYRGRGRRPR